LGHGRYIVSLESQLEPNDAASNGTGGPPNSAQTACQRRCVLERLSLLGNINS